MVLIRVRKNSYALLYNCVPCIYYLLLFITLNTVGVRRMLYYIYIYIYHVLGAGAVCRFPVIRKVYNIILSRNDGTSETATMGKLCTSHCLRPIRNESIVRVLYVYNMGGVHRVTH